MLACRKLADELFAPDDVGTIHVYKLILAIAFALSPEIPSQQPTLCQLPWQGDATNQHLRFKSFLGEVNVMAKQTWTKTLIVLSALTRSCKYSIAKQSSDQ